MDGLVSGHILDVRTSVRFRFQGHQALFIAS